MLSNEYKAALKEQIIKEFITKNGRVPSDEEYFFLEKRKNEEMSILDKVGFSGFVLNKPFYREESSAIKENINREAILKDLIVINKTINNLGQKLEDSFRGFKTSANKTAAKLELIESRINSFILSNKAIDLFTNSIYENFSSLDKVIYSQTSCEVNNGYASLKKDSRSLINPDTFNVKANVVSENSVTNKINLVKLETIKQEDGSSFDLAVYSKSPRGNVSLILEFDFNEKTFISDYKLVINNINTNSKTRITALYSTNGFDYTILDPAEQVLNKSKMFKSVGIDGISKIKLIISKSEFDTVSSNNQEYVYMFSIESISFFNNAYSIQETSFETDVKVKNKAYQTLVMGPYLNTDTYGNLVNFTKAKLSTCTICPPSTYVDFYLSQDGVNWIAVDTKNNLSDIVTFASNSEEINTTFLKEELSENALIAVEDYLNNSNWAKEAYINKCIDLDFSEVSRSSFVVKRNLNKDDGWIWNRNKKLYQTTVYVNNTSGTNINIGNTKVLVNGLEKTGNIFLDKGYHLIETSNKNWKNLTKDFLNEEDLKREDSLYPYNHKYIFSGYKYPTNFNGEKVYLGFEENFGYLMKYISPEKFLLLSETDLEYYTIEQDQNLLKIKVIVDKTDTKWNEEEISFSWQSNANSSFEIYLKANLFTTDPTKAPIIEDFSIRTI